MKQFKIIDLWVSIALMCTAVICIPIDPILAFIIGYFITGGWQIISMVVHSVNGWFCDKGSQRYYYHWVTGILVLIALLGMALNILLFIVMVALLFAAPVMAIFYTTICYNEIYVKMKRPLADLK